MMLLNTISSAKDKSQLCVSIPNKIMYFTFERNSGNTILGEWNNRNATDVNNNSRSLNDKARGFQSAYFNGSTGKSGSSSYRLMTFPSVSYTTNGISISMWVKKIGNTTTDHFIVALGNFYVWGQGGAADTYNIRNQTSTNFTLTRNVWTHLVFTMSNTNVMNVWRNGVNIVSNITISGTYPTAAVSGYFGGVPVGNGGSCINGYIDEFKVYNKILTTTEIQALYSAATD